MDREEASQIEAVASRVWSCPPIVRCEGLAEAVAQAHKLAAPGDTVLLSPACTAFDQYGPDVPELLHMVFQKHLSILFSKQSLAELKERRKMSLS
ncbi:hypothetical protein [Paenibacillus agricola]|uniref:hypothetical protein n=1 Tax=Paenibacillus agricola TaxID=2716264 RepID=UPI001FB64EC3|nr:hypothetical protein [Paenibacillus agricola]